MCGTTFHIYTITHKDLEEAGIWIDRNGVNIPLSSPSAVVFTRRMADQVRKQAREYNERMNTVESN